MMRRHLLLVALLGCGLSPATTGAAAQMVTEVFTIGYRPVDEMVRILRPMVPSPGSVSGAYGKIVVRTTPENMREVKTILANLDQAPANLLVSVRYSMNDEVKRDLYEAFGEVGGDNVSISTGRGTEGERGVVIRHEQAGVRIDRGRASGQETGTQRIRVLEGKEAFIRAGSAMPVIDEQVVISQDGTTTVRRSAGLRDVTSGFYVRARLQGGDRVNVEVFPQHDRAAGASGAADLREASTVVSGRLGRWMEIGGVSRSSTRTTRALGAGSSASDAAEYVTYLKVERVDH